MFDVGAGLGLFSREALARGMEVTALELEELAAEELERALGIPVLRLPFEDYRPDASFDLIVLNQVLEHAHDPVDWACRLEATLRRGGVVVLGMPHGRSFWQRTLGLGDPYVKPPLHLNHFSRRSLTLADCTKLARFFPSCAAHSIRESDAPARGIKPDLSRAELRGG